LQPVSGEPEGVVLNGPLEKYQIATIAYTSAVRRNNPWPPASGVRRQMAKTNLD
jgi:hypothetical protein